MYLSFYSCVFFAAAVIGQGISFTNPVSTAGTSAPNSIYAEGSILDVTWTEGTNPTSTSLVLFQLNATSGVLLYPFEYLTRTSLHL